MLEYKVWETLVSHALPDHASAVFSTDLDCSVYGYRSL